MTTRRNFLKIAGSGIIVLFTVDISEMLAKRTMQVRGYPTDLNSYLRIGEDGRVSLFTGKVEMGQGVFTSLPQMLAEELDVALTSVDPVLGDTDLCPWDMGTFGSMSTRFFGPPMRKAAAEARAILVELGSEHLGVPAEGLGTRDGAVYVKAEPSRSVTYGALVQGKRIERTVDGTAPTQKQSEYTVSGVATTRLDGALKVTGKAKYSADLRMPGLMYAKLLRSPAHGSTLLDVDTTEAEAMDGVRVVRDGDLVAVLHEAPDLAELALAEVRARWQEPTEGVDSETVFDKLLADVPEAQVVTEGGDLATARAGATDVTETLYRARYVAHSAMEPHAAVAQVEGDRITVWASTQTPFPLQRQVAQALGWEPDRVRVITPFVGGGFGGKTFNLQAVEAARLAVLAKAPVNVTWSRREEFFFDTFRPATLVRVSAGLDADKRVAFWDFANMHGGNRSAEPCYHFPNHRVTAAGGWGGRGPAYHPLAVGAWRGPGANVNIWAMEAHMDEMARAAGMSPVDFRMANLTDERMKRVLRTAADQFGHPLAPAPSGKGYGVALATDAGTFVAAFAEVEVNRDRGTVQVKRIVCAQDMGEIVNPEGAKIQMEGCLTMGLGYALTEEIQFDKGAIFNENFDSYTIPRFSWVPKIEVLLVENPELPPQGGGEPAIVAVGAVLCNAIHDAIGVRLTELPMTPGRIRAALAAQ
ncbi:MAG TPA: molybdopterin cofactor-binding domain-containing protein [Longimicrobiales bacterium]|nr:molybdopterin cofactor-binding domain-containing protein [Longimicrobiales bacterium]